MSNLTILAIQNPGETKSIIIRDVGEPGRDAIEKHGAVIKRGAFVSFTTRDNLGNTSAVEHFIADRVSNRVYLQDNGHFALDLDDAEAPDVDYIGAVIHSGDAAPTGGLETFTVYGNNDDDEDFVAVVSATEDTVYDEGVKAGLVDAGYEDDVAIHNIVKGDLRELEFVAI